MNIEFTDEEFQSAVDKQKVLKNFQFCLKERSLGKMSKLAYSHYTLRCGFIANYNLQGYQSEYSDSRFLVWLDAFAHPNWMFGLRRSDINNALHKAALAEWDTIHREFQNRKLNRDIEHLRLLADRLGYKIIPKDAVNTAEEAVLFNVESSGQFRLIS